MKEPLPAIEVRIDGIKRTAQVFYTRSLNNTIIGRLEMGNIIAKRFRFIYLAFGLARLWTFRLVHGLVRCTHWAQVFTCVRGGCDNQRCHHKKNPDSKCGRGREWRHVRKCWGFWGFEKKQLVEIQAWAKPEDFVRYGRRALVGWVEVEIRVKRKQVDFWSRWGETSRVYEMCRT